MVFDFDFVHSQYFFWLIKRRLNTIYVKTLFEMFKFLILL